MLQIIYFYAIVYVILHIIITVYSTIKTLNYKKSNSEVKEYPRVSIVCSAFNEELMITQCVNSFLAQNYPNFEVIIINDGSKDNTLNVLIENFNLRKVNIIGYSNLESNTVRGIYKNEKIALTVVDKENGGISDGQNAGINYANGSYIFISDGDCFLEKDAILETIQPVLNDPNVVSVGGVLQMINNCDINTKGEIVNKRIPKTLLGKMQVLEYLKSYLLGRMGMQDFRSTIIASGAYGLFKTDILVKVGGFRLGSFAEDMDITMKINKYCLDNKIQGDQKFIPMTKVWTEVPENFSNFVKQRSRWGAGFTQCLNQYKSTILPKYKTMGLMSMPFSILFNWLTPILEVFSLLFCLITWNFDYIWLTVLFYIFGVLSNLNALLLQDEVDKTWSNKDVNKLMLYSFLEPLWYHWFCSVISIIGYVKYYFGKVKHISLNRQGFNILS